MISSKLHEFIPKSYFYLRSGYRFAAFKKDLVAGLTRPLSILRVRRFCGLFWPSFRFFFGGPYTTVDITPRKKIKNRLKRTAKSTEP